MKHQQKLQHACKLLRLAVNLFYCVLTTMRDAVAVQLKNNITNISRITDAIAKLRLANVNAVAAKYAALAGSSILLVGDLAQIEAGIRELNLGEIIILDAEGNIVKR